MRHAERLDDTDTVEEEERSQNPYPYELDCPLSQTGLAQAFKTGELIRSQIQADSGNFILPTVFSSPYLRCLQTAKGITDGLTLGCKKGEPIEIHVD